eukprot:CAMPEP_0201683418 /NCGR_PEP_ID=MMETSP0494-20130426/52117_1 /ASSEMBLY_ACC=CAM_ASM_000839 /TAXON_ID=420259 /ORGANISM="Thalassiosira gravida, Strain GMp14c1" /LENGTH=981 /DNA_ID=CAMNT_0048167195 /DNA_START=200 /DNA_END=3143 /DNA_ORIENTATION=-
MKLASAAVALLSSTLPVVTVAQECLLGSFTLEFDGECTAAKVLETYTEQVYEAAGATATSCTTSAEDDLNAKLAAAGIADASELCDQVYATQHKVPFTAAANRGTDLHFEQMFYNGRTDWQEEVETLYEESDFSATSILREDAEQVRSFYDGVAQGYRVDWPGALPNFKSSVNDADNLATCTTNAAMCCWPKDRQANDNNGNCAKAYDENCVDTQQSFLVLHQDKAKTLNTATQTHTPLLSRHRIIMRLFVASALLTLHFAPKARAQTTCDGVSGPFTLSDITGQCTYDLLLEEYTSQVFDAMGSTCAENKLSAKEDFDAKLVGAISDATTGEEAGDILCKAMYDNAVQVPFTNAADKGTDLNFEQMFYNGRGEWQEEVETLYEAKDENGGKAVTSRLREDARKVGEFYRADGQYSRVSWPGEGTNALPNFDSCPSNAAMCCWPKDRQANDNNGNCAKAYDENCVDKDPADNTNLCYVDVERGNSSTGEDGKGFIAFPGDNNDGEGSIHCHGLAWSNDVNDRTARYKANNLFFVSMYDHMYQRGYVKNVPGAPMCGCVEQMPTVSRSDCTQVDLTETFTITYNADAKTFESKLTTIHIDFNSCRGINNRNNDLWAYIAKLYYQKDITKEQFGEAGRIITNTNCFEATNHELNKHSLTPGYDHDVNEWTRVAGRESMYLVDPYGHRAFTRSLVPSTNDPDNKHYGIIYRACQSCIPTHKKIFYRRKTPVPDGLNLQYQVLYYSSSSRVTGNFWDVDFSLHSTYEDALNNVNPWKCPNNSFNYHYTFYGRCSPDGTGVNNQHSRFHVAGERNDVAYFVNKPEDDGLQIEPTNIIKGREYASGMALKDPTDGTIYMTGAGSEIAWDRDDFNYLSEEVDGDHTAIVHVGSISSPQPHAWSKSGIIFRSSLETNAAYYGLYLTGSNGVCFQGRMQVGTYYSHFGCVQAGIKEAWIKIEKQLDMFYSFIGAQETEGGPITWTQIHSR